MVKSDGMLPTATNLVVPMYSSAVSCDVSVVAVTFPTEAYSLNAYVCEDPWCYLHSVLTVAGATVGPGLSGHCSVSEVVSLYSVWCRVLFYFWRLVDGFV